MVQILYQRYFEKLFTKILLITIIYIQYEKVFFTV